MLKTQFPAKKTGFSLIELSIVLVIIGILIAGVIGGVSLIRSATMRSAMGESRAYTVAATSFYNQYDSLPGDYKTQIGNSGGSPANQGDGNGIIEFVNGNGATAAKAAEGLLAWQHLQNSGMITESTFASPTSVEISTGSYLAQTPGTTIPRSKVRSSGWLFDKIGTDSFVIITGALPTAAVAGTGVVTAATLTGVLSVNDALAIDNKADDGKANLGTVQATGLSGLTGCSSGAAYTTVTSGTPCALAFQVNKT